MKYIVCAIMILLVYAGMMLTCHELELDEQDNLQ